MNDRQEVSIRDLKDSDWESLGVCCGFAFHRIPPFDSLADDQKEEAGRDCMETVRRGKDGPLIAQASVVAVDEHDKAVGALLIVLKPPGFRDDPWRHNQWRQVPPERAVETRAGQAHLDWVFVGSWHVGRGVASTMLEHCVARLRERGYQTLTSSFILGNGESMAWHWRNGFVLLPNPASMRYLDQKMREAEMKPAKGQ
jgi:GNAT superfamily N-acetyltransferase